MVDCALEFSSEWFVQYTSIVHEATLETSAMLKTAQYSHMIHRSAHYISIVRRAAQWSSTTIRNAY